MNTDCFNNKKPYARAVQLMRVGLGLILSIIGHNVSASLPEVTEDSVVGYDEQRIDISPLFYNLDSDDISEGNNRMLDLSGINVDKTVNFTHKIYGDSLRERYSRNDVEWKICRNDTIFQMGVFSRQRSISFQKGLVVETSWECPSASSSYIDSMTVIDADGSKSQNKVMVTHKSTDGHIVIMSANDTIKDVRLIVIDVTCNTDSSQTGNASRGLRYMRWLSRGNEEAIVEFVGYHGWNDDKKTATAILPDKTGRVKRNDNQQLNPMFPELQYIVISDLSGKVIHKLNPENSRRISDCGLRSDWYIITEYYTDKTVSRKEYISNQPD